MSSPVKYPIGIQEFEKLRSEGFLYVDKTALIKQMVQEGCYYFLSRPRRFGKSLLLSTIHAYFEGKRELFHGLAIDTDDVSWKAHPVLHLDLNSQKYDKKERLNYVLSEFLSVEEHKYGIIAEGDNYGPRFCNVIRKAYEQTGKRVVILIDEYDKPMLDVLGTEMEEKNRNTLKGFYGTFKAADASLRFVLLTGVTKFSQVSVFSGFNQAKDISMDDKYEAICGITEVELYQYFSSAIEEMAQNTKRTVAEMKALLKKKYDGYHFSRRMTDIYNPFSIINAFDSLRIDDYWYRSGTPTYLARLLEGANVNIQKLIAKSYTPSYFVDYRADAEDPLAMLYQSGYLTIKGYDEAYNEYLLDFPNDEVSSGFMLLTANSYFGKIEERPDSWVTGLNRMLLACDLEGVRDAFTSFLASIPYEANKDERAKDFETHFSYTFYIINRLLGCYTTLIEKQNSKGRADVIIESVNDIFIFEFKLDGSASEALAQIDQMQYALPYLNDGREIHKIGVNISSVSRTVDEWIVEG